MAARGDIEPIIHFLCRVWWSSDSSDIMDAEEDNEESSDADTEDSPVTEDTQNGDVVEDYEAEGDSMMV